MLSLKIGVAKILTAGVIGKFLAAALGDKIPCRGLKFSTADPIIHPRVKAALFWRLYESAEIRFVNTYVPHALDVVELGSSIGVLSCFIRKRIAPECRLICVEADPRLARQWSVNLSLNRCAHNAYLVSKAISYGSCPGTQGSFLPGTKNTEGRLVSSEAEDQGIRVDCVRLSDIIAEHINGDFSLVCDIEGAEAEILHSEPQAFNRCRFAMMELHKSTLDGRVIEADETLRVLTADLGFNLIDRNGSVVCLAK